MMGEIDHLKLDKAPWSLDKVLRRAAKHAMWIGFALARVLPVWVTVFLIIAFEVMTAFVIKDGLALNVLMLLSPVEAVMEWQSR